MNFRTLVIRNLTHYWRANLAVILGVATAVAVLAGALLVGDSVRASLRDLALQRLGRTDFVIAGTGFFREQLAADLQSDAQFAANFTGACPLITLEGVITRDENKARAGGVQIYGVDERFWNFHDLEVRSPAGNDVLLSPALAQELSAGTGDTIILRIEKPSAIPVESLHGRKDDLGRTVRFTVRETLSPVSLGEFSLRATQGAVRAVFVPLKKLQRNLEQEGRANVILMAARNRADWQPAALSATRILKERFSLADLGLKLRPLESQHAVAVETESAVIGETLAERVRTVASGLNLPSASFLTYLVNTMRIGTREVPYSLVTAVDSQFAEGLASSDAGAGAGEPMPPIMLNEWAAKDLDAKVGDVVEMDYYVWEVAGRLATRSAKFRLSKIYPISGFGADRDLAPEYPGITEAENLSDWDPPFPLDLGRVRRQDEDYWHEYRTTPKGLMLLPDGQQLWGTRYGKVTSIRILPPAETDLESVSREYEESLRAALDPVREGLVVTSIREQSLQVSRGATDFGEYFTYFSFFLVVSALLLTTLFFKLGIEQRLREIGLLRAVGYPIGRVRSLFLREGVLLAVLGSLLGLAGAVAYGSLMMYGLKTWWVGAVGTTSLKLHLAPVSLLTGGVAGVVTAALCIWWTLRGLTRTSLRGLLAGSIKSELPSASGPAAPRRLKRLFSASRLGLISGLLGLALLIAGATGLIGQTGGFFGAGTLMLVAALCFWSVWLRGDKRQTIQGQGLRAMALLGFRNASSRPSRSVLCIALIASAAFIIVSVDAFRRDGAAAPLDKKSGTGGYPLLAESLLPLVRDLNGEQGREELNLKDEMLQDVKLTRFRLRPGDDTSCLNLYQPRNPRILAPDDDFLKSGRFSFQSSLAVTEEEKADPWLLLDRQLDADSDGRKGPQVVPVIADANSMTYVLHRKLGDEITIDTDDGRPVRLRLVAALADSIFQGELLISERNFLRLFPDQEGYRFFLIDTPPEKALPVAAVLEDRLSDFGFDASSTEEKLAGFHQVENTYLSTFQTLGGLGLLLGTLGLAAVLLRNVLERRRELALMRAVGYRSSHLALMVVSENAFMLGCGLLTGVLCALLAIAPALLVRGGHLSAVSLVLLLLAVLATGLAASLLAVRAVVHSPLLPALRTE